MIKLVRITTVPVSLQKLVSGQMRFMSENGFEVTMISSDFDEKKQLEETEHAVFIPVNMTRKISPFADLKSLYQLIRILNRLKPTIVHSHTPKAGVLGMIAARLTGIPIRLHTVAGLPLMEETGAKRILLDLVEKITYICANQVYPNSNNLKDFIIRSGFASSAKLKVIGSGSSNGININTFVRSIEVDQQSRQLSALFKFTPDNFVFIFVGRLVRDKGIEELIHAFSQLFQSNPQLRLLLVGPREPDLDPLSSECLQEIHDNSAIIHVGYQSDVKPYLAISNVLAFPSYREGFPNVPMQAGCFDLPCIVTDINGCNEIIVEGENGLIIPTKDVAALRNAMERLYLEKDLYKAMSLKARGMIIDKYDQQKIWHLILEEYKEQLIKKEIVYSGV